MKKRSLHEVERGPAIRAGGEGYQRRQRRKKKKRQRRREFLEGTRIDVIVGRSSQGIWEILVIFGNMVV